MRSSFLPLFFISFALLAPYLSFAQGLSLGSDAAYPFVASFLENLPIEEGKVYECSLSDLRDVMTLAADIRVNVFELIDCFYRWCEPRGARIAIRGDDLRKVERDFDLGGERVLSILAIESLERLETGAALNGGQCALDIYLSRPYEKYIEIGTAMYEPRSGFRTMRANLFEDAYGITVKKFFITTRLSRLELYEPGKTAIYVDVISRPKRWIIAAVTRKNSYSRRDMSD